MAQFVPKLVAFESWEKLEPQVTYALKMSFDSQVRFRFGLGIGLYCEISRASQGYVLNILDFENGEPSLAGKIDDQGVTIIGRTSECNIKIAQPIMSRQHLELKVWDGKILLAKDLGSTNGTYRWVDTPYANLSKISNEADASEKLEKIFGIDVTPLLNEYKSKGSE